MEKKFSVNPRSISDYLSLNLDDVIQPVKNINKYKLLSFFYNLTLFIGFSYKIYYYKM